MQIKDALFKAFSDDHADFGRALFSLRNTLAAGDLSGAKKIAEKVDRDAGAHIAFEETEFYPALKPFLSAKEVSDMYQEHGDGLKLIMDILNEPDNADTASVASYIERVEKLEAHVSDCGELFGAMGGLSSEQIEHLWNRLNFWRNEAPRWTAFAAHAAAASL